MSMTDASPPPYEAERISDGELAYHQRVIAQTEQAQRLLATAQQADAAYRSWSEHLAAVYDLKPGDVVATDGTITRAA